MTRELRWMTIGFIVDFGDESGEKPVVSADGLGKAARKYMERARRTCACADAFDLASPAFRPSDHQSLIPYAEPATHLRTVASGVLPSCR